MLIPCLWGDRANILASISRNKKEEREWEVSENAEGPFSKGFCLPGLPPGWTSKPLSPGTSLGKNLVGFFHAGLREDN